MNVLVTGGAGFIGSHLVNALVDKGYRVIVIDNLSTGQEKKLNPKARFFKRDIRNLKAIFPLFRKIDCVFHVAALPRVPFSIEFPVLTNDHNIVGTLNVLECARQAGVKKLIYSASSSAYGDQPNLPLKESMRPSPMSPYGLQKLTGESLCKLYSELYKLKTVSLRYFNVYGEGMLLTGAYSACVAIFLNQAKRGLSLTVLGGKQTRDFTYIGDVVRANLLAARSRNVGKGEVINIAGGKNYSIEKIAKVIGSNIKYLPQRRGEPMNTKADIRKAKRLLAWTPKVKLLDWLKNQL